MPSVHSSAAHAQRISMPYPVLSLAAAAELLPWNKDDAVRWLRQQELVTTGPDGRECVSWRRVLDHLDGTAPEAFPPPSGPSRRRSRMLIDLPRDPLPRK